MQKGGFSRYEVRNDIRDEIDDGMAAEDGAACLSPYPDNGRDRENADGAVGRVRDASLIERVLSFLDRNDESA